METVDYGNPFHKDEPENECLECGDSCESDWCSETCFQASLL